MLYSKIQVKTVFPKDKGDNGVISAERSGGMEANKSHWDSTKWRSTVSFQTAITGKY